MAIFPVYAASKAVCIRVIILWISHWCWFVF